MSLSNTDMLSCQVQKKNKQQADSLRRCEKIYNITTTKFSIRFWINHDILVLFNLSRQQEECGDGPPPTIYYEEIIPLGISTNPKEDVAPTSHESLSLQLVNNMAYGHVRKTEQHRERDPFRKNQAVPSEAYGQKSKPHGIWWQGVCFSWSEWSIMLKKTQEEPCKHTTAYI